MSETKAAFAETAIQSLNYTIYRYIEDHGEKKLPKLLPNCNNFLKYNRKTPKNNHQVRLNGPLELDC